MRLGVFDVLSRVYFLGCAMHPKLTLSGIKHRVLLLLRAIRHYPAIREWYEIPDNPLLALALKRFPLMSGAMYWPYINHNWTMQRRLAAIAQHFRMLDDRSAVIAHATFGEIELARLDEDYTGLRLVLDKAEWFLREGEIVLNLFINDQRMYSVAFTLGLEEGQPLLLVGALQGSNTDTAQDIYRGITHALHGMRPRDLIMVALKLLCIELNIHRIWAVSSEYRQHNSPYFGDTHKDKVLVAYNEVWQEHGGIALDNGFFEIPATIKRKNMEDIPARKRANYRRRFQMLDQLALDIQSACAKHAKLPAFTDTGG